MRTTRLHLEKRLFNRWLVFIRHSSQTSPLLGCQSSRIGMLCCLCSGRSLHCPFVATFIEDSSISSERLYGPTKACKAQGTCQGVFGSPSVNESVVHSRAQWKVLQGKLLSKGGSGATPLGATDFFSSAASSSSSSPDDDDADDDSKLLPRISYRSSSSDEEGELGRFIRI